LAFVLHADAESRGLGRRANRSRGAGRLWRQQLNPRSS